MQDSIASLLNSMARSSQLDSPSWVMKFTIRTATTHCKVNAQRVPRRSHLEQRELQRHGLAEGEPQHDQDQRHEEGNLAGRLIRAGRPDPSSHRIRT